MAMLPCMLHAASFRAHFRGIFIWMCLVMLFVGDLYAFLLFCLFSLVRGGSLRDGCSGYQESSTTTLPLGLWLLMDGGWPISGPEEKHDFAQRLTVFS